MAKVVGPLTAEIEGMLAAVARKHPDKKPPYQVPFSNSASMSLITAHATHSPILMNNISLLLSN